MTMERVKSFTDQVSRKLALMRAMWTDPLVQLYNDMDMPPLGERTDLGSVFLAGPTSRHQLIEYNWRCEAIHLLRTAGFSGYIYAPEPRGEEKDGDFTERSYIHAWESSRLLSASHPVFWIPRKADELLGLNTNLEFGIFIGRILFSDTRTRIFIGWPPEAERMGLPNHYAVEMAGCRRHTSLQSLCNAVAGRDSSQ